MLSVKASVHQGHPKFWGAGKQCTAISFCAMIHAMMKKPCSWTCDDMDIILSKGDKLYNELLTDKYLLICDLPDFYENYTLHIKKAISGTVGRTVSEEPFMTLADALQEIEQFCFLTIDCYTVCVIKCDNIYRVFDSHSCNDCGMSSPNGTATMTSHHNLNSLCLFVKHLCATIFTEKDDKLFEVTHVDIRNVAEVSNNSAASGSDFEGFSDVAEVLTNSAASGSEFESFSDVSEVVNNSTASGTDFEGFSDVSDGEYACKLYIASEMLKAAAALDTSTDSDLDEKIKNINNDLMHDTDSVDTDFDSIPDIDRVGKGVDQDHIDGLAEGDTIEKDTCKDSRTDQMTENNSMEKDAEREQIDSSTEYSFNEKGTERDQSDTLTDCERVENIVETGQVDSFIECNVSGKCVGREQTEMLTESEGIEKDGRDQTYRFTECEGTEWNVFERDQIERLTEKDMEDERLTNSMIDEAIYNLNDSDIFVQSIDIDILNDSKNMDDKTDTVNQDETIDSDTTIDYTVILPRTSENVNKTAEYSDSDEEMPLSFFSKKKKFDERRKRRNATDKENFNVLRSSENLDLEDPVLSDDDLNNVTENEMDENGIQRGRKRTRDVSRWKRNIVKKRRNEGKSYVSKSGKFVKERVIKKPCGLNCRFKCCSKLSESEREKLFHSYWKMGNVTKQRQFIYKFSTKSVKKRGNVNSRKKFAFRYSLPIPGTNSYVRVCKLFFLNTLNVSAQMVKTAHEKIHLPGVVNEEGRGHSAASRSNKTPDTQLENVRNHIKSFPIIESHYCRKDTKRRYLQAGLSIPKMYDLYCNDCDSKQLEKVSMSVYRKVFETEFNLGFFRPRKDQCDLCATYNNASSTEKESIKSEYEAHIRNKTLVHLHKKRDKESASEKEDLVVACFDLEEVLMTPKSFESSLYYKRRLNTFNFTVYDFETKDAFCYVWNETVGGRGTSEIASCVFDFIKTKSEKGKKEFIFFLIIVEHRTKIGTI